MTEALVREALNQFYAAVNQLQHGNAEPMLALWSHTEDVSQMGPRGGREDGWNQVRAYYEQAARLASQIPGQVSAHGSDVVVRLGNELAYASITEQVSVAADGPPRQFTARATHIYRQEGGGLKLIYRHADAAPKL